MSHLTDISTTVDIPNNLRAYLAHVDSDDPEDKNKLQCLVPECGAVRIYMKKQGWTNFKRHLVSLHKVPEDVLGHGKPNRKGRKSLSSATEGQKTAPKSQKRSSKNDFAKAAELVSQENSPDSRPNGSDDESTSGTMHHLRKMKRRFVESNQPHLPEVLMSPEEKIEILEKTLSTFRSEVDMKLMIIQQILTSRNEQVTAQKKLLDQEHTLFTNLLSHWMNAPTLAATGASINFSTENQENEYGDGMDYDDYQVIEEDYESVHRNSTAGRIVKSKASRKSRRRRTISKAKMDTQGTDDEHDSDENNPVDVDPSDVLDNMSDEDDEKQDEESWNASPGPTVLVKTENEGNDDDDNVDAYPQKSTAEIPVGARQQIMEIFNRGITTSQGIHSHLIHFGFNSITITQLNRYLTDLQQKRQRVTLDSNDEATGGDTVTEGQFDGEGYNVDNLKELETVELTDIAEVIVAKSNEEFAAGSSDDSVPLTDKKKRRKRNGPSNTAQNMLKRMRGEEYVGFQLTLNTSRDQNSVVKLTQDKPRSSRQLGPKCNSKKCQQSKVFQCKSLSEGTRKELFSNVWKTLDWGGDSGKPM